MRDVDTIRAHVAEPAWTRTPERCRCGNERQGRYLCAVCLTAADRAAAVWSRMNDAERIEDLMRRWGPALAALAGAR